VETLDARTPVPMARPRALSRSFEVGHFLSAQGATWAATGADTHNHEAKAHTAAKQYVGRRRSYRRRTRIRGQPAQKSAQVPWNLTARGSVSKFVDTHGTQWPTRSARRSRAPRAESCRCVLCLRATRTGRAKFTVVHTNTRTAKKMSRGPCLARDQPRRHGLGLLSSRSLSHTTAARGRVRRGKPRRTQSAHDQGLTRSYRNGVGTIVRDSKRRFHDRTLGISPR
jgi:hypothetical protein